MELVSQSVSQFGYTLQILESPYNLNFSFHSTISIPKEIASPKLYSCIEIRSRGVGTRVRFVCVCVCVCGCVGVSSRVSNSRFSSRETVTRLRLLLFVLIPSKKMFK
jgi:hypothetical protein